MSPLETMGKMLLMFGAILLVLGLILVTLAKVPLAGRLPGDVHLRLDNASCYFPLMTGIMLSILATLVLNLILWLVRK